MPGCLSSHLANKPDFEVLLEINMNELKDKFEYICDTFNVAISN